MYLHVCVCEKITRDGKVRMSRNEEFLAAILNFSPPPPPNFFFGKPRLAFPKKKKFDLWTFVTQKIHLIGTWAEALLGVSY